MSTNTLHPAVRLVARLEAPWPSSHGRDHTGSPSHPPPTTTELPYSLRPSMSQSCLLSPKALASLTMLLPPNCPRMTIPTFPCTRSMSIATSITSTHHHPRRHPLNIVSHALPRTAMKLIVLFSFTALPLLQTVSPVLGSSRHPHLHPRQRPCHPR